MQKGFRWNPRLMFYFKQNNVAVERSPADRVVRGSNPTVALREFLWAQEMKLRGFTPPMCELVPWEGSVSASLIFLGAVWWLHTKPGLK